MIKYICTKYKGGFPLGEMSGDFAANLSGHAHFYLFIVWMEKYFSSKKLKWI